MSTPSLQAKLYWLPHCSTCQKAKAFLEENGVTFSVVHDIKATPLSEAEVRAFSAGVGSAEALFSKRSMKYRPMGLHEQVLTDDQLIAHMVAEYTFIKRPVVVFEHDGKTIAGFSTKVYAQYFASLA
jgi:arsenate reductase (glutaredoxin)